MTIFNPEKTYALILGASQWPQFPNLHMSYAFYNSAIDFKKYLERELKVKKENVKWLFNNELNAIDIDKEIGDFLNDNLGNVPGGEEDLIIFYTGHGRISYPDKKLQLMLYMTSSENVDISGFYVKSLSKRLNDHARNVRKWIFLDCCFSAAAYIDFQPQSAEVDKIILQDTIEVLPQKGTVLFCASSSDRVAMAPTNDRYTMFCGAFLEVIRSGKGNLPNLINLQEINECMEYLIRNRYGTYAVRPELHCPDQEDGALDNVRAFPNIACAVKTGKSIKTPEPETAQEKDAKLADGSRSELEPGAGVEPISEPEPVTADEQQPESGPTTIEREKEVKKITIWELLNRKTTIVIAALVLILIVAGILVFKQSPPIIDKLSHKKYAKSELNGSVFLENLNFSDVSFHSAKLRNTSFIKANFTKTNFINADLSNANLEKAVFNNAWCNNADFHQANLSDAVFHTSYLYDANFKEANLTNTDFESSIGITKEQLCQASTLKGAILPLDIGQKIDSDTVCSKLRK